VRVDHPELIFTGGAVFAPQDGGATHTTVVVDAGRITAVGDDSLRDLAGPSTRVVDIDNGLLIPGFQDAHVHPLSGGLARLSCDLSALDNASDYLAAIGSYAAASPGLEWISGAGWMMAAFPGGLPRREALDSVVPDRPAYFTNRDGHGAWVNSRALDLAGIDATTPDPGDGRIERDAEGVATGVLHEGAMDLVVGLLPRATLDDQVVGLLEAQRYLHSLGITAWQDAIVGGYSHIPDASEAYRALATSGRLTARVVGALWWTRSRGAEQIAELVDRRERLTLPGFSPTSVKIMQDGVAENFTAAMTSPYLDACGHETSNRGLSMVDPAELRGYVTELDRLGFQVHVHAIGDRAVREALDSFEAARAANGASDNRHHIAHIQLIHPDDVAVRGARRGSQHAAAVGDARAPDGRAHDSLHRSRAGGVAVPVPRARGERGHAGGRKRLAGEQPRPALGHPRRGQPVAAGSRRHAGRAIPAPPGARRHNSPDRVHGRLGVREPPRRHRPDRPGCRR
jgi:predicted amidohydrolase YtcJ